ncbi:MAG: DUF47 family protein [Desulfurococcaceae archaeon]|uniref:DUF47 family protein n=1 Tax=Staphylothermus marinus TaxID=2280 RepID=A0A7C4H957_STAMA
MIKEIMPNPLIDLLLEYSSKVDKLVTEFHESIKLLNSFRIGEARSKLTSAMKIETEVHETKEKLVALLEKTHVHPALKEAFYHFIKSIYRICDWVKEASRELIILPYMEIPVDIRDNLEKMVNKLVEAYRSTREAIEESIKGNYDRATDLINKVLITEEEADNIDLEIRRLLFENRDSYESPVLAILIHDLNRDLEEAVDSCRDTADYLKALLVGWIVS